jgi:predicted ribosomally synthesized peptide with SipW-like signal peptide
MDARPTIGIKVLATALVLGAIGMVAGFGTWSAFSDTASNDGNTFAAGSVDINDDDSDGVMFSLSGLKPNDSAAKCIKVNYAGTDLNSTVKLYGATTGTGLDQYLDLKVTRGTSSSTSFPSCTGFTADATNYAGAGAGVIYSGTLEGFPDSSAAGLSDPTAGTPETWAPGESHVYKFEVTVQNNGAAAGKNATQQFTWEAQYL